MNIDNFDEIEKETIKFMKKREIFEQENLRLKRKLAKKDRKIKALEKRIRELERITAEKTIQFNFNKELERSLEKIFCNMRLVPVFSIKSNDLIVEVREKF